MKHTLKTHSRLLFSLVVFGLSVIALVLTHQHIAIQNAYANGNSGSIWTTNLGCGGQQDVNHYFWGDAVAIHGANFAPNSTHPWTITGQPGQASCNPHIVVASGTLTADAQGNFCVSPAYIVPQTNCGEYTVDVTDASKNDNYNVSESFRISESPTPTPTPVPSPSAVPTPTPSPVVSPSPSVSPSVGPTSSPVPSSDPLPSVTPSPSVSIAPAPSSAPSSPGNSSSLGKDGPSCTNNAIKATMDLRDGNNTPVSGIQVIFNYRGESRQTTSNSNGRAETTYNFSAEDSVYASANGFPSQAIFVSAAKDCPIIKSNDVKVSSAPASHGSVLGAKTLANTGTDYFQLMYLGSAFSFMLIGGTGVAVVAQKK